MTTNERRPKAEAAQAALWVLLGAALLGVAIAVSNGGENARMLTGLFGLFGGAILLVGLARGLALLVQTARNG